VAHERIATEQAVAEDSAESKPRQAEAVKGRRCPDDWGDLDQFSAHASRGVLRHMTEEEEVAGLSWSEFRSE
jgi:hypothetical protein